MSKKSNSLFMAGALVGAALVPAYVWAILPWHRRWGASDEEIRQPLPGDDIVTQPKLDSTRAITIQATPDQIWPWLVQLGQGRGGMYSYEALENLVGCDIHNADRILPEYQNLQEGDEIRMGPEGFPSYTVAEIQSERALVLRGRDPQTQEPGPASWTFALERQPDGSTRLISRQRGDYEPGLANFVIWRVFTEPISFIMEQKMLRTLKQRVESAV